MSIRTENPSDTREIEILIYRAFENHPHHESGAKPAEHWIVNKLRDAKALLLSLVFEDQTGIIGHIAFSPICVNGEETAWYGLGPLSVKPERQGEGVGSALIREALSQLKTQGIEGVVLLGEPEYYGRFGFESQSNLTFPNVPPEYFLALSLTNHMPSGEVSYHRAFLDS